MITLVWIHILLFFFNVFWRGLFFDVVLRLLKVNNSRGIWWFLNIRGLWVELSVLFSLDRLVWVLVVYIFHVWTWSFLWILKVFLVNVNVQHLAINVFRVLLFRWLRVTKCDFSMKAFLFLLISIIVRIFNKIINFHLIRVLYLTVLLLRHRLDVLYLIKAIIILHSLYVLLYFFHLKNFRYWCS